MNAKYLKLLIFTSSITFCLPSFAVEFYRCSDVNGTVHITNMPKSSLEANCTQRIHQYATLLEQDYLNLPNEFRKYEAKKEDDDLSSEFSIGDTTFKKPGMHIFDPEAAYDELMETTSKRDDPITNFIRSRSEAVETILSEEKQVDP